VRVAGPPATPRPGRTRPASVPAQIRYLAGKRRNGLAELAESLGVSARAINNWLDGRAPTSQNRSRLEELVDAKFSPATHPTPASAVGVKAVP
jgi:hypothetical protein